MLPYSILNLIKVDITYLRTVILTASTVGACWLLAALRLLVIVPRRRQLRCSVRGGKRLKGTAVPLMSLYAATALTAANSRYTVPHSEALL